VLVGVLVGVTVLVGVGVGVGQVPCTEKLIVPKADVLQL
jgi:hypothetical protein